MLVEMSHYWARVPPLHEAVVRWIGAASDAPRGGPGGTSDDTAGQDDFIAALGLSLPPL
jgi:hypothetical protein